MTRVPYLSTVARAGASYFGLVFAAGFLLGTIRVLLLVPRLGVRAAELLEMPVMLVVIVMAARFTSRRFALPPSAGIRVAVGVTALMLLVGAELLLAIALQDQSITEYIGSRDPVSGGVYLAMLVVFGAMPLFVPRVKEPARPPP